MAMAKLHKALPSDCHILLQVHDELVFEVPLDKVKEVCAMCYDAFQVPDFIELPMEFSVGHAWGSLRPVTTQVYDKEQHDITDGPERTEPGEHTRT